MQDPVLSRARRSAAILFFVNGVVIASWASRVPAVQQHLLLSAGQLGLTLLGMSVGALPAMSLAAYLIQRYDSRRITHLASLLLCLALPLPALAFSGISLFAALLALGACSGAVNVAVNSQGAAIEARYARPIMASFHALFSLGGLAGSLVGSVMASRGASPLAHLASVACLMIAGVALASRSLLPVAASVRPARVPFRRAIHLLAGLSLIAFSTVLIEGAVADWSAVYLHKEIGASSGVAALGYAAFALTMVIGRATGDRLGQRWGDRVLVRVSALLGACGLGTALLLGGVPATLIGFACVGLGCASVYPTMVRASARIAHISTDAAIAAISTAGYMGFFIGPPLIGMIADHVTLRGALVLIVAVGLLIAYLAPVVEPEANR